MWPGIRGLDLKLNCSMDPLTHLFITRKVIGAEPTVVVAGLAADTPFYLTYPAWVIKQGQFATAFQSNEWPEAPRWMKTLHHICHSLPVLLTVTILIKFITGKWPLAALAWGVHILIDIPTHSRKNWAPQFLWPLSSITVDGLSWTDVAIPGINRAINKISGRVTGLF
ncbi:MAG TPA: hypothetical protein P5526_30350 [Anaerolineae bacterium]|nr:hypothetical protein [Anaerolineae bacterium]